MSLLSFLNFNYRGPVVSTFPEVALNSRPLHIQSLQGDEGQQEYQESMAQKVEHFYSASLKLVLKKSNIRKSPAFLFVPLNPGRF